MDCFEILHTHWKCPELITFHGHGSKIKVAASEKVTILVLFILVRLFVDMEDTSYHEQQHSSLWRRTVFLYFRHGWNSQTVKSVLKWHPCVFGSTVWCCYNVVNFLQNCHKMYPIARLLGWGMGRVLWVQTLIYFLPQLMQWCVQYHVILYRIVMAHNCMGCVQTGSWLMKTLGLVMQHTMLLVIVGLPFTC